jgi:Short C-terminal domain
MPLFETRGRMARRTPFAKLHAEGVLTDEEFAAQKQKLLG